MSHAQTAHLSGYQTTVPVQGTNPADPLAIAVDAAGNLFVSDLANDQVVRLQPTATGYAQTTVMNSLTGLGSPRGLTVDSLGNLYIADQAGQQLWKVPVSGTGYGTPVALLPAGIYSPEDVAIDPYGYVFFTCRDSQVYYVQNTGGGTVGTLSQVTGLTQALGLAWQTTDATPGAWKGNLFIADNATGQVFETSWGSSWSALTAVPVSGLSQPYRLTVDASGSLYIPDLGNNRVVKVPYSAGSWGAQSTVQIPGLGQPAGVAVDGSSNLYVANYNGGAKGWVAKESTGAVNFGQVAVGSTSTWAQLQFTLDTPGKLGATAVLTQGVAALDFADASGGSCATGTTYAAGDVCTLNVKFSPLAAGKSQGAAVLQDALGYVMATGYLYGSATGPQIAYLPGTETTLPITGAATAAPVDVAVDAARTLFVSDLGNTQVVKITTVNGYSQSPIVSALGGQRGVALDGAGNVYVADYGGGELYKIPWNNGAYGTKQSMLAAGYQPVGVVVDGAGNLYFTSWGSKDVYRIASDATLPAVPVALGLSGLQQPYGLAVDAAGNLFIADLNAGTVTELPRSGNAWGAPSTVASGLSDPANLSVDASGSLYISEWTGHRVLRLPWTGSAWGTATTVATGALSGPQGVAIDNGGNLYVADYSGQKLLKEDSSDAPTLNFALTEVTATSADSPQTLTIANIGTEPLHFSALSFPADFPLSATTVNACSTATALAAASTCNLTLSFLPTWAGNISEILELTDNHLNQSGAKQQISLTGIAYAQMMIAPTTVTFSDQVQGTTANAWTLNLSNISGYPISGITINNFTGLALTGSSGSGPSPLTNPFSIQSTACGSITGSNTLAAYSSCNIAVVFTPPVTGDSWDAYAAVLEIKDASGGTPLKVNLYGTGTAMAVQLNPSSISFGTQAVGGSSPVQVATLTNASSGSVTVNTLAVSGSSSEVKITATTCGSFTIPAGGLTALPSSFTLAANANCTITMVYTPTAAGTYTGTLQATTNGQPATLSTALSATATAPSVFVSPDNISFATQTAGSVSNATTVTFNNTSNVAISGVAVSILGAESADFGQTNTCPATLAAYTNCNIYVTFHPQAAGNFAAVLQVANSAEAQTVTLSGTGTAPTATLAPNSLNFGSVAQNTTSSAQTATFSNTSDGPVTIASIGLTAGSANFLIASGGTCAASTVIPAHGSCTILVAFKPATTGNLTGTLTVLDSAASSPHTVGLVGVATSASAAGFFAPASVAFGNQTVGSTSNAWGMTLNNTSSVAMTHLSFAPLSGVSGEFAEVNSCGSTLAANATCSISVTFTPSTTGARTGSLVASFDGGSLTAAFTGTGVAPTVALAPSSLNFGNVAQNSTSAVQTLTLTNTSAGALTGITVASGNTAFIVASGCGSTLAAYQSCTLSVSFKPTAVQGYSSTLTVTDSAGTQTAALTGTGVSAAASLSFSPSSVSFGNQTVGSASNSWGMTLNNTGSSAITGLSFAPVNGVSGEFAEVNSCGTSLAANSTCSISVTFTPTTTGARSGSLVASFNGGSLTALLTGTGVAPTATLAPNSLAFGNVVVGSQSADQYLTLSNTSGGPIHITGFSLPTGFFTDTAVSNVCSASGTLSANSSCNIGIYFRPATAGTVASGSLEVSLSYSGGNLTLSSGLSGTGVTPSLAFTPSTVNFGNVALGVQSLTQQLTLVNNNAVTATVGTITLTAPFAKSADTCSGTTLSAYGGACQVTLSFTPPAAQSYSAGLLSAPLSFAGGSSGVANVTLTGTGTAPTASLAPSSLDFGTVVDGLTKVQNATLSNTSNGPLTIASMTANGGFSVSGGSCGATLAANSTCAIQVTFTPTAVKSYTETLTVTDNSTSGTHTIHLTGTGVSNTPSGSFSPAAISFGSQTVGSTSGTWGITLSNSSSVAMSGLNITLSGANANDFAIPANPCGTTLNAGASCSFNVTFTPTATGNESATLTATFTSGSGGSITALLSGSGTAPTLAVAPQQLDFGNVTFGSSSGDQTVTLTNSSAGSITLSSAVVAGTGFAKHDAASNCGTTLAKWSSCTIAVNFTPTAGGNAAGTLTITDSATGSPQVVPLTGVGKVAAQTITFAPISGPFIYGMSPLTLAATGGASGNAVVFSVLSGPATVSGSKLTITGAGYVVVAADQAGNTQYAAATQVQQGFTVDKAVPVITWNTPADIAAGSALTTTSQLNAIASVAGTFLYSPAAGTVLGTEGTQTLWTTFTPSDTNNYNTASASVQIKVTAPVGTHVISGGSYLLYANPSTLTLQAGQSGTALFSLQPQGGFTGTVALSCAGLPAGATCSFSPATLTSDGQNVKTSVLTIHTASLSASLGEQRHSSAKTALAGMLFVPALLGGLLLAWQRKRIASWGRFLILILSLGLTLAAVSGCGASFVNSVTSTHTIQIQASASATGSSTSSTQSGVFTLTITQ